MNREELKERLIKAIDESGMGEKNLYDLMHTRKHRSVLKKWKL